MSEEEVAPAPVEAKKKSPLLLIIVGLVSAALTGSGAWWFFGHKPEEPEGEPPPPPVYHRVEPAFVVNIDDRGALRYLQVEVQVMTRDATALTPLITHAPVVRDALLRHFSRFKYGELMTEEGRQTLQSQTLAVLRAAVPDAEAAAKIEAVYFTSFVVQ